MRFNDAEDPAPGGSIEVLVNGGDVRMLENICVDGFGRVLLQEDPGNQDHIAEGVGVRDEESSGIIDAQDVPGAGWYLLDVQAHASLADPELVQRGQLVAMYIHPRIAR